MIPRILFIILLFTLTHTAWSEPVVIADYGGRSTGIKTPKEYFEKIGSTYIPHTSPVPIMLQRFPIRSDLAPGLVENRKHNQNVSIPIFIVGDDRLSLEWLSANSEYFGAIKATGIVTNVDSYEALQRIKALAPSLQIEAMPIDVIAKGFGLSHYPLLIDNEGIKQ